MKKNVGVIIGLIVIAATLVFGAGAFQKSLMNYVSIEEAKAASGATVQVMGAPTGGRATYQDGLLHFAMTDGKTILPVIYKGPKPDDLDTAMDKSSKITAQGEYDPKQGVFVAENLLVKCPSKYQGERGSERSYSKS